MLDNNINISTVETILIKFKVYIAGYPLIFKKLDDGWRTKLKIASSNIFAKILVGV